MFIFASIPLKIYTLHVLVYDKWNSRAKRDKLALKHYFHVQLVIKVFVTAMSI